MSATWLCLYSKMTSEAEPSVEPEMEPEPEGEAELSSTFPEPETELEPEPEMEPEAEGEAEAEAEGEYGDVTAEPEGLAEFASTKEVALWISLYSIFIVMILAGNVLIIGILLKNKHAKRSATNLFLLSLLLARACIAVFVVPARITGIFSEEYLGSAMCKLCHFCALGSSVSSVLSTMGVALSKYLEVVHKSTDFNVKRTVLKVAGVWIVSYIYATRKLVLSDLTEIMLSGQTPIISCTIDTAYLETSNAFIFVDIAFLFLIPFLVILFCYVKVIRAFRASQREQRCLSRDGVPDLKAVTNGNNNQAEKHPPDFGNGVLGQTETPQKMSMFGTAPPAWGPGMESVSLGREFFRNAQMLVTITLLFTICTSVPYIWRLYMYWTDDLPSNYQNIDRAVYLCSYANPWINVFVFLYFRNDIRDGFKKLCGCGCGCQEHRSRKVSDELRTSVVAMSDVGKDSNELA